MSKPSLLDFMKFSLLLLSLASHGFAASPIQERTTPEALVQMQNAAKAQQAKMIPAPVAAAEKAQPQSLINESCIIQDGNHWTLVPKTAVIFFPAAKKDRVNAKPVGEMLLWADFLALNRNWITTTEITFDQAAGTVALPAERVAYWQKQDKVIVATHQAGPISVKATTNVKN
jgi:hypothetical protein